MSIPLYYVGTPEEVAHHARPLARNFDLRIVSAEEVVRVAQPGEVCVFFNEYFPRFRDACLDLKAKGCPTLYAIDGILEWRNSWELPEHGSCCLWVMRPVLSHKVACIGRSQARVLESWGNLGKCEIVGVPRFDSLANRKPRQRQPRDPFRVLIITAKCPGFSPDQVARTKDSLADLKRWFDEHPRLGETTIEPVWRITQGLEKKIGVENRLSDTTGADLATVLQNIDAIITTPSTAMLEGMLQGVPVALLDYHNRPHYVPAAWRITADQQIDRVLSELMNPTAAQMLYQHSILHDALECHAPATPRLVELIHKMHEAAQPCLSQGEPIALPRRLLADSQDGHHLPEPTYDHASLFPARMLITGAGRKLSHSEAVALARREGMMVPSPAQAEPSTNESLDNWQTESREWGDITASIEGRLRYEHQQEAAHWQRQLQAAQRQLRMTQRELSEHQRGTLSARLTRLSSKVRRLLHLPQTPTDSPADQSNKAA
jgi:hypothetical protein